MESDICRNLIGIGATEQSRHTLIRLLQREAIVHVSMLLTQSANQNRGAPSNGCLHKLCQQNFGIFTCGKADRSSRGRFISIFFPPMNEQMPKQAKQRCCLISFGQQISNLMLDLTCEVIWSLYYPRQSSKISKNPHKSPIPPFPSCLPQVY